MASSAAFNILNCGLVLMVGNLRSISSATAPLSKRMLLKETASICIPFSASRQSSELAANAAIVSRILSSTEDSSKCGQRIMPQAVACRVIVLCSADKASVSPWH